MNQFRLNEIVREDPRKAFEEAFEAGDELTEAMFTIERGAGAMVGRDGQRFTRMPRADLNADGEWTTHLPAREAGPVAQSCIACHAAPYGNGAGPNPMNGIVDPLHSGDPKKFLVRNTPHLFALGAVQRIAEEMTAELKAQEAGLGRSVCETGKSGSVSLVAKGVSFGILAASPALTPTPTPGNGNCVAAFDTGMVEGVDADLIIKMFGWKGAHASLRTFTRHAAHNELGMQAVELVGETDGDHDGVTNELTIGDLTALTIYMAALERPTSKLELAELGLMELGDGEAAEIRKGEALFAKAQCSSCHMPVLEVVDPMFREPSRQAGFFETTLPSGQTALEAGLLQDAAVTFDLTADSPNNHVVLANGDARNLGAFPKTASGGARIAWYSDFKRHDMGEKLADPVDVHGFGASVWPTRSLAGVGSTGPWLHNGNATTLHDAIIAHGGEAEASRSAYEALPTPDRQALVAFLENLILQDLDPK
ncbi:di-heme oxidoredictase family protein [Roseibium sediminis]|uniref:di-heme oxidoredictase family protein n=1 Tax=Roseibium sediminis TaxID=1775174 RepID=UPI0013754885|nr:di-heme oxidoredictase family protein [Roseibium sediminis]